MNLRLLRKSRKAVKAGSLFVMLPPDDEYLFGRVIADDAVVGPIVDMLLIYIYDVRSSEKRPPPLDELCLERLLVPPIVTNRQPWLRGYFEEIEFRPLAESDRLERHCFADPLTGKHFDEYSNETEPTEQCGIFGVTGYMGIDDKVSEALGIPVSCGV